MALENDQSWVEMAGHCYGGTDYSLAVHCPRKGVCSEALPDGVGG